MSGGGSQPSGSTTTTANTTPWSGAQPYLTMANQGAANLFQNFTPQYFPGSTYSPLNPTQSQALQTTANLGANPYVQAASAQPLALDASLMGGSNLSGNPGFSGLSSAYDALGRFRGSNSDLAAVYNSLSPFASNPNAGLTAAARALDPYSSGSMLNAASPFESGLAQSVASSVVPSIEKQFIDGGGLSSPGAAYSTAQGFTTALAPTLYANAQAQEQLQQQAIAQQAGYAQNAQQMQTSAIGQQAGVAQTQEQLQQAALAQQAATANSAGSLYNTGIGQELAAAAQAPSSLGNLFAPAKQEYSAGGAAQTDMQNQINAAIQKWNYGQTLPYQQLQQLEGTITGQNFGSVATTQPYFQNNTANALGTIGGGLSAANSAIGMMGKGAGAAGGLSAALPALAGAAAL